MPYTDPAGQASGAAAQLELTWKRWREIRGLPDGTDPVATYVRSSQEDPMGQARVVIGVDVAEALAIAEMISYFIASRPLAHSGASSGPWPAGDHGDGGGQVASCLSSFDLAVPSPDTAEAERPIMRNSLAGRPAPTARCGTT